MKKLKTLDFHVRNEPPTSYRKPKINLDKMKSYFVAQSSGQQIKNQSVTKIIKVKDYLGFFKTFYLRRKMLRQFWLESSFAVKLKVGCVDSQYWFCFFVKINKYLQQVTRTGTVVFLMRDFKGQYQHHYVKNELFFPDVSLCSLEYIYV